MIKGSLFLTDIDAFFELDYNTFKPKQTTIFMIDQKKERKKIMAEITITKENFEKEVMQSDKPVLLDFWASWCGPCRMVAPVVEQIANEYDGQIKVGKINIDEQRELSRKYKVVSIPTLMVIKDGQVVNQSIGFQPKESIMKLFG